LKTLKIQIYAFFNKGKRRGKKVAEIIDIANSKREKNSIEIGGNII